MSFIMSLDPATVIDLIGRAFEEERKDKVYQQWLVDYPRMEKFMPFDEYYEYLTTPQKAKKSDEEIIQDSQNILKSMSKPK